MLVRQGPVHHQQDCRAQQDGRADGQACAPRPHTLGLGGLDAGRDQRKGAGGQHHPGAKAEHAVLHLLRDGAGEENGKRAQRGGGGRHQAAQQRVGHVRRAHVQGRSPP
ncbi:hypothetical protein G6F35_014637 [Rhizopus arrhizus]|nr:hypothetical protein G6F35_014637 [Rhizopus arrhizus]